MPGVAHSCIREAFVDGRRCGFHVSWRTLVPGNFVIFATLRAFVIQTLSINPAIVSHGT